MRKGIDMFNQRTSIEMIDGEHVDPFICSGLRAMKNICSTWRRRDRGRETWHPAAGRNSIAHRQSGLPPMAAQQSIVVLNPIVRNAAAFAMSPNS
jgi:hypothetical protein